MEIYNDKMLNIKNQTSNHMTTDAIAKSDRHRLPIQSLIAGCFLPLHQLIQKSDTGKYGCSDE
jgi:hypothetical protein